LRVGDFVEAVEKQQAPAVEEPLEQILVRGREIVGCKHLKQELLQVDLLAGREVSQGYRDRDLRLAARLQMLLGQTQRKVTQERGLARTRVAHDHEPLKRLQSLIHTDLGARSVPRPRSFICLFGLRRVLVFADHLSEFALTLDSALQTERHVDLLQFKCLLQLEGSEIADGRGVFLQRRVVRIEPFPLLPEQLGHVLVDQHDQLRPIDEPEALSPQFTFTGGLLLRGLGDVAGRNNDAPFYGDIPHSQIRVRVPETLPYLGQQLIEVALLRCGPTDLPFLHHDGFVVPIAEVVFRVVNEVLAFLTSAVEVVHALAVHPLEERQQDISAQTRFGHLSQERRFLFLFHGLLHCRNPVLHYSLSQEPRPQGGSAPHGTAGLL